MFSFVIGKLLIYVGHVKNLMAMSFLSWCFKKQTHTAFEGKYIFSLKSKTKKRIYVYLLFFSLRHLPLVPCSFFILLSCFPFPSPPFIQPTSFSFPSPLLLIPFHLLSSLPFATPPHLLHGISSPSPSPLPPLKAGQGRSPCGTARAPADFPKPPQGTQRRQPLV